MADILTANRVNGEPPGQPDVEGGEQQGNGKAQGRQNDKRP
ncbi:hypothetical protein ACET9H_00980 [Aeromonas media]|nr:hypothetical protein [Aeromonas media]